MSSIEYKIVNGPSKEKLFDALRLYEEKRFVPFTLKPLPGEPGSLERATTKVKEITRHCQIVDIGIEDGSGDSWLIKATFDGKIFSIYYRTDVRTGHLR